MENIKVTDVSLAAFFGLTRQTVSKLRTSKRKAETLRYSAFVDFYINFIMKKH